MSKYVYSFGGGTADGDGTMKDTLGGKGAGLAEMSRAGLPVPPGFTIATDVCNIYFKNNNQVPAEIQKGIDVAIAKLEKQMGQKLGDAATDVARVTAVAEAVSVHDDRTGRATALRLDAPVITFHDA